MGVFELIEYVYSLHNCSVHYELCWVVLNEYNSSTKGIEAAVLKNISPAQAALSTSVCRIYSRARWLPVQFLLPSLSLRLFMTSRVLK